jgi:hypothetical protein
VCELAAGTVIAPGAVAELLGSHETLIQRVVADGTNRIRDISTTRSFRGTLRRVLEVLHRRCEHGTCFVPAAHCQGDLAWSHGGLTTQDNGRLGCGFHNRWWYTTGQSHPPPRDPPLDAELADDELDDPEVDDELGPRSAPRLMFRIALVREPDIRIGNGEARCTIDLDPQAGDRWRDYPVRLNA